MIVFCLICFEYLRLSPVKLNISSVFNFILQENLIHIRFSAYFTLFIRLLVSRKYFKFELLQIAALYWFSKLEHLSSGFKLASNCLPRNKVLAIG